MNFKEMLEKISILSEDTKETEKGRVHKAEPGGYGRKHDTDEEGDEKKTDKPEVKRGRGRPKKGSDETGEVKKYEFDKLGKAMGGGKAPKDKPKATTKHTLKDWFEMMDKKIVNEVADTQPIAVVGKEGNAGAKGQAGFISAKDPNTAKAIGALMKSGQAQVVVPSLAQPAAGTTQPAAGSTGQPPAGQTAVKEKWGTETKVSPEEKGKYSGKSKEELTKAYNALKKSGPHKKGSKEFGRMRELAFAIRAKSGWGKVQEADRPSDQVDMGAGLGAGRSQKTLENQSEESLPKMRRDEKAQVRTAQKLADYLKRKYQPDLMAGTFETRRGLQHLEDIITQWLNHESDRFVPPGDKDVMWVKQHLGDLLNIKFPLEPARNIKNTYESKSKPDFLDLDKDKNKKEPMKKAAKDMKKDKVNESMHKHNAAKLLGKAHALAKEGYNPKFEDMEEARMYHEGYKEGLDECYGMMPIRGKVVDETGAPATPPATTGGMASAAMPAMEAMSQDSLFDSIQPVIDFAMSKGYTIKKGKGHSIDFMYDLGMGPDEVVMNARVYFDKDFNEPWVNFQGMGVSGTDPAKHFLGTFKENHEAVMDEVSAEKEYRDEVGDDDLEFREGNAFTGALAKTPKGEKFSVGGKTFTDTSTLEEYQAAFESLDKQLNQLLTEGEQVDEGMSVSISKGQQGSPDSVTVSAQDAEAEQLLGFIKQAGLGLFGDSGPAANYGAPDGDSSIDHGGIKVVGDHDGMMGLMKKLSGIEGEPQSDYEDEEEGDEEDHLHGEMGPEKCNECGSMMEEGHQCEGKEVVDEVETDDQRLAQVAEDNPPDSEEAEATADEDAEAEEDLTKPAFGGATNESVEGLNEWANDAGQSPEEFKEETFTTDMEFMLKTISGGLNKPKSTGQQTIPVLAGDEERTNIKESTWYEKYTNILKQQG